MTSPLTASVSPALKMGIKIILSHKNEDENTQLGTGKNKDVNGPYN